MAHFRYIVAIFLSFILSTVLVYADKSSQPDFAYPQKVSKQADKDLKKALKNKDGIATIKALVEHSAAQCLISSDNLTSAISRIEDITSTEKNPCTRAILNTLLADIYSNIYMTDRWKYDHRDNPLLPLPTDYNTWDGNQFKYKITTLCDSALVNSKDLKSESLRKYSSIITHNNHTFIFYPTLYDFIARHTIDLLNNLTPTQSILSFSWLCRYDVYQQLKFTYSSPTAQRILNLYQNLLAQNSNHSAAFIDCDIARIKFLSNAVYKGNDNDSDKTTFEILKDLYLKYSNNEYSAEILDAISEYASEISQKKWLYNAISEHLNAHPAYFKNNCLRNIFTQLSEVEILVNTRNIIIPGDTIRFSISNQNATKFSIDIYQIPDTTILENYYRYKPKNSKLPKLVKSIDIKVDSIIPFNQEITCTTTLDKPGNYFFIVNSGGKTFDKNNHYQIINCSNLAILSSNYGKQSLICIINPHTGIPVANAEIYSFDNNKNKQIGVSNDFGWFSLPSQKNGSYNYSYFAKKDDNTSELERITNFYPNSQNIRYYASCFTDLAIYHPGDSVKWSAIVYCISDKDKTQKLSTSEKITVTIRDVNYQIKDTTTAITDEWGRISGTFSIPKDGLTGNYFIQLSNYPNNDFVTTQFTVSDYKLPTYFVEISNILNDTPTYGDVTFKGKSETYSGFPLSDIDLTLNLSVQQNLFWRTYSSPVSFYSNDAKTDSNGNFSITIPSELLANSPIPNGIFTASITALSNTGESQTTSETFTIGKTYYINASLDNNIDISKPTKLNIKIVDMNDVTFSDSVFYQIKHNNKPIYSGKFFSTNPIVNWEKIPSGQYSITFSLADSIKANTQTINNINLYRLSDTMPPVDTLLWVPITKYTIDANKRKASVIYGTTITNCHIEYTIWNDSTILSRGWLTPSQGVHKYDFTLPQNVYNATITLCTTYNYQCLTENILIEVENSRPCLKIEAESFRDKIMPNSQETWKFRITDNTGNGSKSALIFDMYTKALDALKTSDWTFSPQRPHYNIFYPNTRLFYDIYERSPFEIHKNQGYPTIKVPQIENISHLCPQIFNRVSPMLLSNRKLKIRGANTFSASDNVAYGTVTESAYVKEEEITKSEEGFSYRATENPLAFFEPMLTTDDNGNISFTFTVPNANTTWRFCAIAYNQVLTTSNFSHDVISNKPIMVQPNMPRFLRTGDCADIKASIMNNSDTIQFTTTTVELFDPSTNAVANKYVYIDTINAGQSTVITTTINTPFDNPILGYRIKSATGTFTDGEQSLIPILPSLTPVINSNPFYIAPDSTSFNMQLPDIPDNANVTLQFCENPTWYCVTALPGICTNKARTSLDAMTAIFSTAIAQGIIRNNPDIALALHQWQHSNKSDSILVSMLERNQDLKTVLLSATPWMMDARSDSERMSRLALLFDKKEIESTFSRNVTLLAELQRGKGGWGWISESTEPSQWCTLNILEMCGKLKQLGYLPNEKRFNSMIENAIKYIDDYNARNYSKYPKQDYSNYAYIRGYFNDIKQSTAAQRVTTSTVQKLISNWRQENVTGKAIAAIILNNNGYHSTAKQVLNSLREYAQFSPSKGMWWSSLDDMTSWSIGKIGATSIILDAFNAIEPSCQEIDLIRQWLILQKEAKDWGTSVTTSNIIASILNSGTKWIRPTHNAIIKIGNKEVTPSHVENATGYFRTNISTLLPANKTLSIQKPGNQPSWGAVFSQFQAQIKDIKPASCNAVSIEKRIYRQIPSTDGVKWEKANTLSIGDRIKVELLVIATQDMDYVTITDDRAACFAPIEQLPHPIFAEGIYFYRENRDAVTNMFVTHLPKGTYLLSYELFVNNSGQYASGIATIQSQYAPSMTAHSGGRIIKINQ